MAQQWEVQHATGRCTVTGRDLVEGEEFYTVLTEDGESFTRADISLEAWDGPPEGAFCHFKTRVPMKEKRKRLLVNNELLKVFFERLAEETEPVRVQFRFVLALILMRKRLLKYNQSSVKNGVEVWDMTMVRDHVEHRVVNPQLNDEQIETVSGQLSSIIHSDMGEWAVEDGDQPPPSGVNDDPSNTAGEKVEAPASRSPNENESEKAQDNA